MTSNEFIDYYPHYNTTADLPDNLDLEAGLKIISMNVGAVVERMQIDVRKF
jgi:hypothetical protein